MKRRSSNRNSLLATLILVLSVSACDFQAAQDAFDDFQIVIGLDPINSPVSGVVYDGTTGEMLSAQLSFAGAGAASLIDAYSDPLPTQIEIEGGAVTFGISNGVIPSETNPFSFTVAASVPGYYPTTRTVTVTEVGGVDFEVRMVREVDANSRIEGTASIQDGRVQSTDTGVQQTVTIQTMVNPATQASASATISAGSVALSSSGQPLSGQFQTQMRAYDPMQGSTSLPQGATQTAGGSNQAIIGAVYFLMTDAGGQAVANFTSSGSGKAGIGKHGACEQAGGFLELVVTISDAATVATVQALGAVTAQIWGYTPADGANNLLGETTLSSNGGNEEGTICVGGTLGNVDLNNLGDVAQGAFFTLVLPPNLGTLAPLALSLTVNNVSSATTPGTITLQGPGVYANRSLSFPGSSKTRSLAEWLGVSGDYFVSSGASYTITVQADGGAPTSTTVSDPSSGSAMVSLTQGATMTNYTVHADFTCPAGTTFDVAVSNESLDAVSVFYRRLPDGQPRVIPNDASVTKDTDQSTYIRVTSQLSAIPGETYEFTGVLDNERAIVTATPPAGSTWDITLDSDDVGVGCSAD